MYQAIYSLRVTVLGDFCHNLGSFDVSEPTCCVLQVTNLSFHTIVDI